MRGDQDTPERREYQRSFYKAARTRMRKLVDSLKDSPCVDCGGKFPPEAMDFDHTSDDKVKEVSDMMQHSLERVLAEVEKCELVCANCHRTRTRNRRTALG